MLSAPAIAEKNTTESYPYTLFAASTAVGAITVNASNFCVNGNVATNGTIVSSGNMNVNGTKSENTDEGMVYIFDKIDSQYFSGSNVDEFTEDYTYSETNITIDISTEVEGETMLTGNININTALKSLENINLYGEVKNTNDSVIFSKYGDIVIDSTNVNLNGLVYAPFGDVTITAQNLNLNNVVIIADTITFTCPNVNANYSSNAAELVGNTSELLDIPLNEWQYLRDGNENGLPDFFENYNNWKSMLDSDGDSLPNMIENYIGTNPYNADTDGDGLPDNYELPELGTDPITEDTDENGIFDGDEDFDEDGLTNLQEYQQNTEPYNEDTDGDEIYFECDPNNTDTDENGILDGDEKRHQMFTHIVENDCAIEEVRVLMEGTGNLQKTTTVDSVMDKDILCTDVVGLVGEPFEIETTSEFDTAILTFVIDKEKLGDTEFNNLLFLWYDKDNNEFVELETVLDEENSTVSIETTHFSRYMVVDKYEWYEAWAVEFNYNPAAEGTHGEPTIRYNTVLTIDCSGSMSWNDPITIKSNINSAEDAKYPKTCQRIRAATNFVRNINVEDKAAVVLFESSANNVAAMTDNSETLLLSLQKVTSSGGTNFYNALCEAYEAFEEDSIGAINTNNRIILLSDGEDGSYSSTKALLNSIYDDAGKDERKTIKIYTIGLGSSADSRLEEIAEISGGEFYKAYTAEDLVEIYAEIGFGDDFDKTDTDGDGLYDAVETAGIRLQNGKIIYSNPTKSDTDGDGLLDGEEINPKPIKSNKQILDENGNVTTGKGYSFELRCCRL